MNITTAAPASLPISTANVQTEVVQTQNRIAERVPEAQQTFKTAAARAAETGPNQTTNLPDQEVTQENRPRIIGERDSDDSNQQQSSGQERQEQREQRAEQAEIAELAAIDRKVRAHEQAHASVGGVYAGSPTYTYKTGPNGVRYAVGGSVSIDISPVPGNPEATLRKAEQVARAALAPADPSPTDRRVAQAANALAAKARVDIARANAEAAQQFRGGNDNEDDQGPQPFDRAGISLRGGFLSASLRTDATEQVGGQVSASA